MTRLTLTLACVLLCILPTFAQEPYTVESIPNNRPIDDSRVSNPDGILTVDGVNTINSMLIELENQTTVQVAVVAVTSIGDADIFDFAQELFNTWGIGQQNNNGVLVLLVTGQRTVRIHTGTGIEPILTDVTCKRIERDYMVPSFKAGNYEAGMIGGVQRIYELLLDPSKLEELEYDGDGAVTLSDYAALVIFFTMFYAIPFLLIWGFNAYDGRFANSKRPRKSPFRAIRIKQWVWVVEFGLIPLVIVLAFWPGPPGDTVLWSLATLYIYFMGTLFHRLQREWKLLMQFIEQEKYYEATQFVGSTRWFWFFRALLFPVPFGLYFVYHLTRKSYYRNHPRTCKLCKTGMKKLGESEDDAYLDARQQFEEKISALDYDIWLCPSCKATREWHYVKSKKYVPCPKCHTQSFYVKSRRTVVSASYESAGEGKETRECKYCGEVVVSTYRIPRLVRSTSRSGSSGSSSSSWGGGSSSGGGASSSW